MKVSLVLATVNRMHELRRFLASLQHQTYRKYELIIVDQNPDARLEPILEPYCQYFPIIHVRCERGLSRARNVGLRYIAGDIIGFPDDDCWYPKDLLERVVDFFRSEEGFAGLCGRAAREDGTSVMGRWAARPGPLTYQDVWFKAISFTIFVRREVVNEVGPFDERLGVGSGTRWGSGEETDYLIRAIERGFRLWYDPSLVVYHPEAVGALPFGQVARRSYRYACGLGFVLGKHSYPKTTVCYWLSRPLLGAFVYLAQGRLERSITSLASFAGRLVGWLGAVREGR